MKRWIPIIVLLLGMAGMHSVMADTPDKFQPFLGRWRLDSTLAFRCPCTLDIREAQENGSVVGSFYLADGQDVLTEAKIVEAKHTRELTVTLLRGDKGWLELSQDRQHLSGLWERLLRRAGGTPHSRTSRITFAKIVQEQEPAATK